MTQIEKQLLLKDLCARLPYGTYVHHKNFPDIKIKVIAVFDDGRIGVAKNDIPLTPTSINECKPYLRPMSSMTEEEKNELGNFVAAEMFASQNKDPLFQLTRKALFADFFNAHHFDYRGLIERGLALEAPEGMYKTE